MFKTKLIELLQKLGMIKKFEEKTMSNSEWAFVASEFKKAHGIDFLEAVEKAQQFDELKDQHKAAIYELVSTENKGSEGAESETDVNLAESIKGLNAELTELKKDKQSNQAKIKELERKIAVLEAEPETDKPLEIVKKSAKVIVMGHRGAAHSAEAFMGLPGEFFSRKKWWNEVGATRKLTEGNRISASAKDEFKKEFDSYGESLSSRIRYLHESGLLGQENFMGSIDYSNFDGTGWGDEYIVRRQDELISYLRALPTVAGIFPVRYGVQNKMVMTNSFLTEFSQAGQDGEVFKGGYEPKPEEAKVDDAMFKHKFSNLKQLEKEYIGYLNREGSDPMKWNFIEWLMKETLVQLHNEKEQRRILGRRVEPVTDVAGPYLFASDGIVERLWSYVDDYKIEPFDDLGMYTASTILDVMEAMAEKVNQILPSLRGFKLYANEKHIPWALAGYRTKYGTDMDFKGGELALKNYNIDGIVPVPNMGNRCIMWITLPGNIELYELEAGEMEKLYFERRLENLIVASWWKEGSGAYRPGRKYASLAELQASKRKYHFIFMNNPVSTIAADATTADGSVNNRFKTSANTGATAITVISNADEGIVYRITCGNTTNATTIAKSGSFSEITATWTPTAVGDYLEVYYRASDSKFIEVARKVS